MSLLIDSIKKWLSEYNDEYKKSRDRNYRSPLADIVRHTIPDEIDNIIGDDTYIVKGSVGKGNWTDTPWIAVLDKRITTSAQTGIYIVYLVNKDSKKLFLTLNQGVTKTGREKNLKENAKRICKYLGLTYYENEGRSIESGKISYNTACICFKEYSLESFPSEDTFKADLKEYIELYQMVYEKGLYAEDKAELKVDNKTGVFDSWIIIDERTAIKNCDKSFFDYNTSGVPKEIKWFFNADTLSSGESRDILLKYCGEIFSGKLLNDIRDSASIRWPESLGKLLEDWSSVNSCAAWFYKKEGNVYEVMMKSEEKPMSTVKETINNIKAYIASKGFSYDGSLIENFYLSLKTKPFVILAGTSGTGKTKLVRLFAEAIGAEYQLVPVRPDWSDSSDLFGHVDLNGKFNEGIILPFVKKAELNPGKPYFLCLDEMNLARVEYYLSDVLSVIETREKSSDGRIITDALVPTETFGTDVRAKEEYSVVRLPENLYIVGTVNMDETTFPFSRKVLDRANTIEFSYVDMIPDFADKASDGKKQTLANEFLKTRYLVLTRDCADDAGYVTEVCEKLQTINEILKEADAHVGYRVRDEIAFYMLNNRKDGLLSEDEAFDNEIMQKILPRIHGGSSAVKNILQKLFKQLAGDYSGYAEDQATCEQMKAYLESKGTAYPKSAEKITYMIRRYEEDGFTSYWI